jgi:hypothetical protein
MPAAPITYAALMRSQSEAWPGDTPAMSLARSKSFNKMPEACIAQPKPKPPPGHIAHLCPTWNAEQGCYQPERYHPGQFPPPPPVQARYPPVVAQPTPPVPVKAAPVPVKAAPVPANAKAAQPKAHADGPWADVVETPGASSDGPPARVAQAPTDPARDANLMSPRTFTGQFADMLGRNDGFVNVNCEAYIIELNPGFAQSLGRQNPAFALRVKQVLGVYWKSRQMVNSRPFFRQERVAADLPNSMELMFFYCTVLGREGWHISNMMFCNEQGMRDVDPHAWLSDDADHMPDGMWMPYYATTISPALSIKPYNTIAEAEYWRGYHRGLEEGEANEPKGKGRGGKPPKRGGYMPKMAPILAAIALEQWDDADRLGRQYFGESAMLRDLVDAEMDKLRRKNNLR